MTSPREDSQAWAAARAKVESLIGRDAGGNEHERFSAAWGKDLLTSMVLAQVEGGETDEWLREAVGRRDLAAVRALTSKHGQRTLSAFDQMEPRTHEHVFRWLGSALDTGNRAVE